TFIDRSSSLAVTSGIAVMPTKEAALRVSRAGDPSRYEWFRGMGGKRAPDLDRAGGYAAATVRGRYVAYAYVQWADGRPARPGDAVIKQAVKRFLDYDLRPIVDRARRLRPRRRPRCRARVGAARPGTGHADASGPLHPRLGA